MREFQLELWELPPDAEIKKTSSPIEFGHVEWDGETTLIAARTVRLTTNQIWAFFRPLGVEANFVVASGFTICPFQGQMDAGKLERIVRKAIKGDQFSFRRAFYVEGELCLMSPYRVIWKSGDNQSDCAFETPFDAMREPSARIFEWLRAEWENPDSHVRFAWDWNRKNAQQRQEYLEERVPRWRELFQLVRAIARVAELPENSTWILDHVDTHSHSPELLARLEPWREFLLSHFMPFEPFPDSAPLCLREYFQFISSHVAVRGENVSQHEHLDARLSLQEWLQGKATPGETRRLLGDEK